MACVTPLKGTVGKLYNSNPAKTSWSEDEREPLHQVGKLSAKARATFEEPSSITILQGPFGVGKSIICHLISQMGLGLLCPKGMSTAWHPSLIDQPVQRDLRSWAMSRAPSLESTIVGMQPPYAEWEYWARRLGITSPTHEELVSVTEDLIACFLLEPMAKCMRVNKKVGMELILELFASHTKQFVQWLAGFAGEEQVVSKLTVIQISAPVIVRTNRIHERFIAHPSSKGFLYDNIVERARELEGASMPEVMVGVSYQVHHLDNSKDRTEAELAQLAKKVCRIVEQKHSAGR